MVRESDQREPREAVLLPGVRVEEGHGKGKEEQVQELTPELESEYRSKINQAYCHTKGTESFERKVMFDEIDRLRECVRVLIEARRGIRLFDHGSGYGGHGEGSSGRSHGE